MTSPDIDAAMAFLDERYGERKGFAVFGFKREGSAPDSVPYDWPRHRVNIRTDLERRAPNEHVFYSPFLFPTPNRKQGNAIHRDVLWLDMDDDPDRPDVIEKLNPFRVSSSGRKRRGHLYFPLSTPLDDETWHRLARQLRDAVGGGADAKIADNDWLRLPGTVNFKEQLSRPRRVRVTADQRHPIDPDDLKALISPYAPETSLPARVHDDALPRPERVPQDAKRGPVRVAMQRETSDRSQDIYALVATAREHGLTVGQTLSLALDYPVAQEKWENNTRDIARDVQRCWNNHETRKPNVTKKKKSDNPVEVLDRRTSWTLDDLMREEFPELRWVVPGLLPEGLTLLVAAPKIGKSYLTTHLALSLTHALDALGSIQTEACEVLLIPLDDPSPRRMQKRIREITAAMPASDAKFQLHIELDWPTLAEGGAELLDEWLEQHPNCRVVIIDTLSRLRDDDARKSSDPGKPDEKAMAKFKAIADHHHIGIIGTHHDRKNQADDFIDAVAGNKKLTGGADTIIYLTRARNQRHTTARITGRDVEEQELALIFEHPLWVVADQTPAELGMSDTRQMITMWLRDNGGLHKVKEIAAGTELDYDVVKNQCFKMAKAQQLVNPSRGLYGLSDSSDSRVRAAHRDNRYNVTNEGDKESEKVTRNGCNAVGARVREAGFRPATKKTLDF